jgi:hypothetical protein
MEPYFAPHAPADIRKLQKEEKERANKLVNESSTQFLHEFNDLAEVHVRLLLGPEEFLERVSLASGVVDRWLSDLENPVLVVVDRKTF